MGKTSIGWTDYSWNPIRASTKRGGKRGWHCEKVSPGCAHCYAETFNARGLPNGGTGLQYLERDREKVSTYIDPKVLAEPSKWKKPRRVFVCSMTDLFGEWVTDEEIERVFAAMAIHERHTFQVLTKRAARMREWCSAWSKKTFTYERRFESGDVQSFSGVSIVPLPNVWLGVSVENQTLAEERVPILLETPAAKRFVSAEPLLGPVDFRRWLRGAPPIRTSDGSYHLNAIDWTIVGGESGPQARPVATRWISSIVERARAAGSAVFVKQLGSCVWEETGKIVEAKPEQRRLRLVAHKGDDPLEWPVDLYRQEFPS